MLSVLPAVQSPNMITKYSAQLFNRYLVSLNPLKLALRKKTTFYFILLLFAMFEKTFNAPNKADQVLLLI